MKKFTICISENREYENKNRLCKVLNMLELIYNITTINNIIIYDIEYVLDFHKTMVLDWLKQNNINYFM